MRSFVLSLLVCACVTPAAVEETAPDENDADARGAERDELLKLLSRSAGQPDESKILLRLAELEAQQGRLDEKQAAERKVLAAEAKQRDNPTVHDAQQAEADRFEQHATQLRTSAVQHLETFGQKFPTDLEAARATFELATIERAMHHDDRADAALARVLHEYPSSPIALDAHLMLADRQFEKGDMTAAIVEYDAAAKGEHQRAYATYKRGWCRINLKQPDLALTDFATVMNSQESKIASEAAKDWVRAWAMIDGSTGAGAKAALEKFPHPGATQTLLKRLAQTYRDLGRDGEATETDRLAP